MMDINLIAKENYELGFIDALKLAEKETGKDLSHLRNTMDLFNSPKRYGSGVWGEDW